MSDRMRDVEQINHLDNVQSKRPLTCLSIGACRLWIPHNTRIPVCVDLDFDVTSVDGVRLVAIRKVSVADG